MTVRREGATPLPVSVHEGAVDLGLAATDRWVHGRYKDHEFQWRDRLWRLPDGREALGCRECGAPVPLGRVFYCSGPHSDAWKDRNVWAHHWPTVRRKVLDRDGHRCVLCGAGPGSPAGRHRAQRLEEVHITLASDPAALQRATLLAELHRIHDAAERSALEVDHIRPVARFPELEHDPSNLRTLCHACHAQHGARPTNRTLPVARNRRLADWGIVRDGHEEPHPGASVHFKKPVAS